jgi:hypothetical protein
MRNSSNPPAPAAERLPAPPSNIAPAKFFDEEFSEFEILKQLAGAGKVEGHYLILVRAETDATFGFVRWRREQREQLVVDIPECAVVDQ